MRLKDWRLRNQLSQKAVGELVGRQLKGEPMQARTLQRYETGEQATPPEVVEAISIVTEGAVTPIDMHRTRIDWSRHAVKQCSPSGVQQLDDQSAFRAT